MSHVWIILGSILCVWCMSTALLLITFPSDENVRAFVEQSLGSTPVTGVGVSLLFMLLPSVVAAKLSARTSCVAQCSFQNTEVFLVMGLCIVRASAGIALFTDAPEYSVRAFAASCLQLQQFMLLKSVQKVAPFQPGMYLLTYAVLCLIPIVVFVLDLSMRELILQVRILQLNMFGILCMAESMFATYVEKTTFPNPCISVACLMVGLGCVAPWVKVFYNDRIDEQSLTSGFFSFGFMSYYLGYRLQEKRLQSDVLARFHEVARDDIIEDEDLI